MEEVSFSRGPARRPLARVADPLLQWSTGLQTQQRSIYAGWLIQTGRMEALDEAMQQAGFSTVTIRHSGGNLVTHWAVETADLFVIAEGVQSIGEMRTDPERYGIAYAWRTLPDGRPQSVLKLRALMRPLLEVGYTEPLLVSVKSTLTGDMLEALMRQYDVLDAIDRLRTQQGQTPLNPPFYACSIPLGPGAEVARGGTQKKEIVPMVAQIPTPIERPYLVAHYIRKAWVPLIENLLDATMAWSVATSNQIALGEDLVANTYSEPEGDGEAVYSAPRNNSGRVAESPL